MPLGKLTESLGKKRAAHLLRRACFGASIAEIDQFSNLTPQEAFERLYIELPDPAPPVDLSGQEWISSVPNEDEDENELMSYLRAWMVDQAVGSTLTDPAIKPSYAFRERLIFFFHTLFTTKISEVNSSRAIYFQRELFRKYAFDRDNRSRPDIESTSDNPLPDVEIEVNIKELTKKVSVDNAMLIFLDGRQNVKGSPNENYARELLELYSIGRGLEGHVPEPEFDGDYVYFTEQDVQAGAKVLSGFTNDPYFLYRQEASDLVKYGDPDTGLPRGILKGNSTQATQHDNSTKQFSSRFGNSTITPNPELYLNGYPSEKSLLDEISQLVDLIYAQDQTPIHICRRLYRYFVYHTISEELENDVIKEMADILVANNYKIYYVLEALFTSSHFYDGEPGYDNDNFGGIIKSPFDLVVGFHKNFNLAPPIYSDAAEDYFKYYGEVMIPELGKQGMDFYEPYEVAGYSAYHQFPIYNRSWITTNYLTNRYSFISDRIATNDNPNGGEIDILNFTRSNIPNSVARDAKALIKYLAEYFLPMHEELSFESTDTSELTAARLNYFLNAFLFEYQLNTEPEITWTTEWDNEPDTEKLANSLMSLYNAMLQSPEYQLM
ncbi:DUF1800 domain-containing protein [Marinoscillum pacificum]|uniref:DUF1800 domain-containing protein n=1 Tax=Marinoscillum pacificum TaxID=392723 RepID=UPI0021570C47|nr:DUF1800 domain-containing protein [Marinoscillum pacificum]